MLITNPPAARTRHDQQAFTLIELLVVISIIVILASLSFPAVNGAIDSARKARAGSDVTQIATAVVAYEVEYGRLPITNSTAGDFTSVVDLNFIKILTGENTNANANPRKIAFIEVTDWKKGKGGTNSQGWGDPWDSNSLYSIVLDGNYDNKVDAGNPSTNLFKKVAVWSTNSNTRRRVTSW